MDEYDGFENIAKQIIELYEIKYNIIKPVAMNIISNKIVDAFIIEHILDETLDIPTNKGYELHISLCKYYSNIDKESAQFYIDEYHHLWDDDYDEEEDLGWSYIKK